MTFYLKGNYWKTVKQYHNEDFVIPSMRQSQRPNGYNHQFAGVKYITDVSGVSRLEIEGSLRANLCVHCNDPLDHSSGNPIGVATRLQVDCDGVHHFWIECFNLCSYQCRLRYIQELKHCHPQWMDAEQLTYLEYGMTHPGKVLTPAPARETLKCYGGFQERSDFPKSPFVKTPNSRFYHSPVVYTSTQASL